MYPEESICIFISLRLVAEIDPVIFNYPVIKVRVARSLPTTCPALVLVSPKAKI